MFVFLFFCFFCRLDFFVGGGVNFDVHYVLVCRKLLVYINYSYYDIFKNENPNNHNLYTFALYHIIDKRTVMFITFRKHTTLYITIHFLCILIKNIWVKLHCLILWVSYLDKFEKHITCMQWDICKSETYTATKILNGSIYVLQPFYTDLADLISYCTSNWFKQTIV